MSDGQPVLQARGLVKHYGRVVALDHAEPVGEIGRQVLVPDSLGTVIDVEPGDLLASHLNDAVPDTQPMRLLDAPRVEVLAADPVTGRAPTEGERLEAVLPTTLCGNLFLVDARIAGRRLTA